MISTAQFLTGQIITTMTGINGIWQSWHLASITGIWQPAYILCLSQNQKAKHRSGALPHTPRFIALVSREAKKKSDTLCAASLINPHRRSGRSSALPYPPVWESTYSISRCFSEFQIKSPCCPWHGVHFMTNFWPTIFPVSLHFVFLWFFVIRGKI